MPAHLEHDPQSAEKQSHDLRRDLLVDVNDWPFVVHDLVRPTWISGLLRGVVKAQHAVLIDIVSGACACRCDRNAQPYCVAKVSVPFAQFNQEVFHRITGGQSLKKSFGWIRSGVSSLSFTPVCMNAFERIRSGASAALN